MNVSFSEPVLRATSPEVLDFNLDAAIGFDPRTHPGAGHQLGVITARGRVRWHINAVLDAPTLCVGGSTRTVQRRVVA